MPRPRAGVPPTPPAPSEEELAELRRRGALTPYRRHKELVAKDAERRARREQEVRQCQTWEERPLLCRLGIHRPSVRVGRSKNSLGQQRCLRCGFEWEVVV